jgi:AraC family transcriptional regulator
MPNDQYLQRALEYIDKNITGDISLYEISCEAGFSVPHFYRLFKKLTGDTVGAYILRRKLSLAAKDLIKSRKPIGNIAFEYGFESHDVFTRAFTRVYGVSPKKYRQGEGLPPLKRHFTLDREPAPDDSRMTFCVLDLQGFDVIGMECNAVIWDGDGAIGRLWSDFLARVDEIKHIQNPMTMYGICEYENCENGHFRYMAAVGVNKIAEIPKGMVSRCLKAHKFFQADVPASISVPDAYSGTIGYMKSLGYEPAEYDEIEVYDEMFRDPAFYRFQLLIPIKE